MENAVAEKISRDLTSELSLGIIVIGRNEGTRLETCLKFAIAQSPWVVYVDSGSTDESVACARALGVEIVALDLSIPFTAARARNVGLACLLELNPVSYVQFVDGDCELNVDWCRTALTNFQNWPTAAVICGRRRERFPQASVFNLLCDLEWDTPIGEAIACGGDALMRVAALQQVGGYNPELIAGEEPELCLRLRQQGWQIFRVDHEMTLHDARIMQIGQWWKRAVRGGHAYAEVSWLHRHDSERMWIRESLRIWIWGFAIPLLSLGLIPVTAGWSLLLGLAYLLLVGKIYRQSRIRYGHRAALYYAISCVLIKFPELQGQMLFHFNRLRGDRSRLIEYKTN
jgi:glycosyltransferase involved in cell wall biosynthesis